MFKVLFSYPTVLSVSVMVPQILSSEKSSSRRISPVWFTGMVALGRGALVLAGAAEGTVSVAGGIVGVEEPSKLDAINAVPANPNKAHAPIRQPAIRAVGIPALVAVFVLGRGFG